MLDKLRSEKTGMIFTKLEKEISDLENLSMDLRDQIDKLETQEANVANKIAMKKKQMNTQLTFNFKE